MIRLKVDTDENDISSKLVALKELALGNTLFSVPIYQRLYVWKKDQIAILLADLYKSFRNKDAYFYLGGIIIVKNNNGGYDLIDGQQRFTTLWLIGYVLGKELEPFIYARDGMHVHPRLSFAIREYSNEYFKNPASLENLSEDQRGELAPLADAIEFIEGFFSDGKLTEDEKWEFSGFVYRNVKMVATEMPVETDENKLFEATNNRGEQLQQHEILKSKFLKYLLPEDRPKYAQVWEACSIMDEYIERNIKEIAGLTWAQLTFGQNAVEKEVELPKDIIPFLHKAREDMAPLTLLEILNCGAEERVHAISAGDEKIEYDSGKVRSIISFPMLLLHTLRIFLFRKNSERPEEEIVPVDGTRLLSLFEEHFQPFKNREDIIEFIDLLWRTRIKFDKHVIKWVTIDKIEIHSIKKLYLNDKSLQRRDPDTNTGFSLLQSMLYHSQEIITHYWLTPFLNKMLETDTSLGLSIYLKKVDNAMFCTGRTDDLRLRSWNLMGKELNGREVHVDFLGLDDKKGTKFPSYVFYKLDFILWTLRGNIFSAYKEVFTNNSLENWDNFRMTSRSSVEHISPQIAKEYDDNVVWEEDDLEDVRNEKLNDFGNLVLLSVSMNSEYGNKTFRSKMTEFWEKGRMDSLKSALIFENQEWNYELCVEHREKMKTYLQQYFELTR